MMHRYCFEASDRTIHDILGTKKPFREKVVVLGRDFRQILAVLQKASIKEIVHSISTHHHYGNIVRYCSYKEIYNCKHHPLQVMIVEHQCL